MATEWLDGFLNNRVLKEATIVPQGENREDHMERKVQAFDWIKGISDLDPAVVEAEYNEKLRQEALMLGKTAALDDVIADGVTPEEIITHDIVRDVKALSDYALAELLAEARGHEAQNTNEMYYELKEKAKTDVASSREKAEKTLLELIPQHSHLDWQKAFKAYKKDEKPAEPKEKDLYKPEVPEKAHDFEHPTEDKFKLPKDPEKALAGNGREADERTDVTAEAGVLKKDIIEGTSKDASLKSEARCKECTGPEVNCACPCHRESSQKDAHCGHCGVPPKKEADGYLFREELYPTTDKKAAWNIHAFTTKNGNTLQFSYDPDQDLLLVDLVGKDESGGNEIVRMKLNEDELLEHTKESSLKTAVFCPICGNDGEDLKNGEREHIACKACGIMYAEANLINKQSDEIKVQATKEEVIKKIAELQKTAEVASPWQVVIDPTSGNEVIARVDQETKTTKESTDEQKDELVK